ncbi:MAG: 4Fe-4S dicluster domain-containing protein [Thermodesulfobacteriota bacterium]
MKWERPAEEAVARAPFFVRKKIRRRVEEEARRTGAEVVSLAHVRACQQRFLSRQDEEVRGFQVETCFGPSGCPNRAVGNDNLARRVEEILEGADLKSFLKEKVGGPLKFHHEFRVSISDCPNACSRPQIADVGLIGARRPKVLDEVDCSGCGACVETCQEGAVTLPEGAERPVLDSARCLACGQCLKACPTGTLAEDQAGYRVLVGGRLGRHPRLAQELPGIRSAEEALETIERCLALYRAHNRKGERFADVLARTGPAGL